MSLSYIIHLANYSDGILYILAFLLLVALTVMIDRFWALRVTLLQGKNLIYKTEGYEFLSQNDLHDLHKKAGSLPEAKLFEVALRNQNIDRADLSSRLDESIMLMAPKLDRRLWVLDTVVTLAPLMGLFGTIIGMFHAFNVLALPGHAPIEVTGGVADALAATAFGIFIAMLGLAGYNALTNQVRHIVHQLESLRTMLVNRTDMEMLPKQTNISSFLRA